mgnify:CR=1 FL=1
MEAYRTAFVYVREEFAGVLKETDYGYSFQYDKDYLASEVLAVEISNGTGDNSKEWNVNGEKITFSVVKA